MNPGMESSGGDATVNTTTGSSAVWGRGGEVSTGAEAKTLAVVAGTLGTLAVVPVSSGGTVRGDGDCSTLLHPAPGLVMAQL